MAEERYILEKQLGSGGMGEVWLATDSLLNRPVAVKFLQVTDNPMFKDLFLAEARTLASLQHPNITLIYDAVFDEYENRFYIMMEYVEGQSLSDLIKESSESLSLETIFEITTGILKALKYAHEKNIVHRDIKPDNVVIQGGNVKLTDFGLATLVSLLAEDKSQYVVGTPAYMSPEHILGEGLDGRADLYSLGVTLFEMITGGTRPFNYKDRHKLLSAQIEETPPSVRELEPTVPMMVDQIIMKMLAKHPDDRYPSASVLLDIINGIQARHKFSQRYFHSLSLEARPLVGRVDEFKKIETTWAKTQQTNTPHLLIIRGEMGIGKSKLVTEFLGSGVIDKGLVAAVGRCDEVGAPYTPFAEILASIFDRGLVKPATAERQMNQILNQIPGLASILNIERSTAPAEKKPKVTSSGLWKTLGNRVPGNVSNDTVQSQWQFFSTVSTLMAELGPTALFLDEAIFLDESSLALTHFLVQQDQLPLLIVAECRDTGNPILWLDRFSAENMTVIALSRLSPADVKTYLSDLLEGEVSDPVVNIIDKRGRGNPFHIEEVARQLIETGEIFQSDEGEWRYKPPTETDALSQELLSPLLATAFTRRLEKLTEKHREILALAAIIEPGPEFDFDVWLAVLGGQAQEAVAKAALDEAVQLRLVRASSPKRYVFRPADISNSLMESLPESHLPELHRLIAEILIEKAGNPILIGHHYEQAGLATESAHYLEKAGARAMAANAINQAIRCYSRAVELVATQPSYEALGNLYRQQGAWADSIDAFQHALGFANQSGNVNDQARIQNNLSFTHWLSDNYQEASKFATTVLKLNDASHIEHATAQSHLGMISRVLGHLREAEGWCRKAVDTLAGSGDEARLGSAYNRLGMVYLARGKYAKANEVTKLSLEIREKLQDDWGKAYSLITLGKIKADQGEFEEAKSSFSSAQQLFEKIGSNDGLVVVYTEQGRLLIRQGHADESIPLLDKAMRLAQEGGKGSAYGLGDIFLLIAQARLAEGEIEEAKAAVDNALSLVEAAGNQAIIAAGQVILAQIYAHQNEPEHAEKMYDSALTLFEQVGSPPELLRSQLAYAHFLADQGETDEAAKLEADVRIEAANIGLHL